MKGIQRGSLWDITTLLYAADYVTTPHRLYILAWCFTPPRSLRADKSAYSLTRISFMLSYSSFFPFRSRFRRRFRSILFLSCGVNMISPRILFRLVERMMYIYICIYIEHAYVS